LPVRQGRICRPTARFGALLPFEKTECIAPLLCGVPMHMVLHAWAVMRVRIRRTPIPASKELPTNSMRPMMFLPSTHRVRLPIL